MTSLRVLDAKRVRDPLERFGRAYALLDFTRNRYRVNGIRAPIVQGIPGWAFSRASTGYALNSQGRLVSFASGEPRITDRGFLVEGARTNLFTYSQAVGSWASPGDASISSDTTTAPDGTLTADTVTMGANATTPGGAATFVASTTHAISIYFHSSTTAAHMRIRVGTAAGSVSAYVNLSTKAMGALGAGFSGGTVEALADGWYRASVNYLPASGDEGARTVSFAGVTTNNGGTADTGNTLVVWGVQVEAGAGASSYIPTTAATATRAADIGRAVATPAFPYSSFADFERAADDGNNVQVVSIDSGSSAEATRLLISNADVPTAMLLDGGAAVATISLGGAVSVGERLMMAASFNVNDVRAARGGTLGTPDTSAALPDQAATLRLGTTAGGAEHSYGYIRRVAIWPRALSNAELQALTI